MNNDYPFGTRVKLDPVIAAEEFISSPIHNPVEFAGTVVASAKGYSDSMVRVIWDNGAQNVYDKEGHELQPLFPPPGAGLEAYNKALAATWFYVASDTVLLFILLATVFAKLPIYHLLLVAVIAIVRLWLGWADLSAIRYGKFTIIEVERK